MDSVIQFPRRVYLRPYQQPPEDNGARATYTAVVAADSSGRCTVQPLPGTTTATFSSNKDKNKVDAGVAVLLTEDKRLIEFPSILLPPDITSGSIVDIHVTRNFLAEQTAQAKFAALQDDILQTFGQASPSPPVLRCRNATQTSVVLEWDPVELATAELRSLSLYRNGSKAGNIPRDKLSTKISGLAIDTEFTFHLVLRTTAGTYTSNKLTIKTQKMTDLTGITVTPGVMPQQLRDDLAQTLDRIGAKLIDTLRIDTTHFVCTEGRGQAWEKAQETNVPVVVPDWVKGCEREGRIVGVRGYYLNADPKLRQMGPGAVSSQSQSSLSSASQQQAQAQAPPQPSAPERRPSNLRDNSQLRLHPPMTSPRIEHTPPTPERTHTSPTHTNGVDDVPPTPPPKFTPTQAAKTAPPPPAEEEEEEEAAPRQPTGLGLANTGQTHDDTAETVDTTTSSSAALSLSADTADTVDPISKAHTPDVSPRTPYTSRFENFEKFEPTVPQQEQKQSQQEQSQQEQSQQEQSQEQKSDNALDAVGIPHEAEIVMGKSSLEKKGEQGEQEGYFDEVDL